jgi:A/G-specific adenine glycosylase
MKPEAKAHFYVVRIRAQLLSWYARTRRDLPWRKTRDPYAVWLSETMLQQTRVETVVPYYLRFLQKLPTLGALADATEERVLALWSGLGYYRRARMLHAAARQVVGTYQGRVPREPAQLQELSGIGAYTAGAIASIAFGRRAAAVDGNVARVLARLYAIEDDVRSGHGSARVWRIAEELVPDCNPGDWNQALMELGATVCVPREPKCEECPVRDVCAGYKRGIAGDLPHLAVKRPPRTVRRVAIVLASARAVLLARRRADVLFGGLWEPPSTDRDMKTLARRLDVGQGALEWRGEVVHVLSHRRMHVRVVGGDLGRRRRWALPGREYEAIEPVALEDLAERGLATLTRKILAVANVAARGIPSKA